MLAFTPIAEELGLELYLKTGDLFRGWAFVELGKGQEGLAEICKGLSALDTIHKGSSGPHNLFLMAEACGQQRRQDSRG